MLIKLVEAVGCTPGVDPICDLMRIADEVLIVERSLETLHNDRWPISGLLGGLYFYLRHPMDDPCNPYVSLDRVYLYQKWLYRIGERGLSRFIRRLMDRGMNGGDIRCVLLYLFASWENFKKKEKEIQPWPRPWLT